MSACVAAFFPWMEMPLDLASNIYSTNTLVEGVHLVKQEEGMDMLNSNDVQLDEELARLEASVCETKIVFLARLNFFCWKTTYGMVASQTWIDTKVNLHVFVQIII